MSSGITFSGANGIDWNMILNAVMAQEQVPLTTIQTQKQSLTTKSTAFSTLATKLGALGTASDALKDVSAFGGRAVTTTDGSRVTADAGTGSFPGIYDVVVNELARSQVSASSLDYAATDSVTTAGTLTVGGVTVTVTDGLTLQGLADAINSAAHPTTAHTDVTASVVSPSSGRYQLVLTGTDTGAANAFTAVNGPTGGTSLTFVNKMTATDALFSVNNVNVSSSTNVVDDAIPGTTLTLLKKDPLTTVTVSVTKNDDATKAKVQTFIDAYNDLLAYAQQQTSSSSGIGRDPLLRQLRSDLRNLVSSDYGTGAYTSLAQAGVGFDRSGKLSLDSTLFNEAMSSSAVDVQRLFIGDGGTSGVFDAITSSIDQYTDAGGLIANSRDRINEQIVALDGRLLSMESRLALRRAALQREYMATDQLMGQLSSQASSLSSLDNQYSLF
jgi:flagellar hook-associated protein 2